MAVFGSREPVEVSVVPYLESRIGTVKPAILNFMGAVGLLLATATANVAGLQLARAMTRRRETAIRAALGAGMKRILAQFLVESSLLGLAGGLVGTLIAAALLRVRKTLDTHVSRPPTPAGRGQWVSSNLSAETRLLAGLADPHGARPGTMVTGL